MENGSTFIKNNSIHKLFVNLSPYYKKTYKIEEVEDEKE